MMRIIHLFLALEGLSVFFLFLLSTTFYQRVLATLERRDYENRHYYVVHFSKHTDPETFSGTLGFQYEEPLKSLDDHHLISIPRHVSEKEIHARLSRYMNDLERDASGALLDKVYFYEKQELKKKQKKIPPCYYEKRRNNKRSLSVIEEECMLIQKKLQIPDPLFHYQWHLLNCMDLGNDINVTNVWEQGITGKNITVAIIDDGLDFLHEDLKANYNAEGSYDFNTHSPYPRPRGPDDKHGTRCAGEIAAARNDHCGVGVAYDSKISGIRLLSELITTSDEAQSLNYKFNINSIYSCSWGPADNGRVVEGPSPLVYRALINGINNGRNGLGSIYVFASGNGGKYSDNCNFDGYANSVFTITIGAINRHDMFFRYSEMCTCQLAVTYSGDERGYIYTTDVGQDKCSIEHGGTSAAAPLAAGMFSLVLSIRPDLTWRDLQALVVETAVPIQLDSPDWEKTYKGRLYHKYLGYGKLSAYKLVEAAKTFKSLKAQARFSSDMVRVYKIFNEHEGVIENTIVITEEDITSANLASLEHVTVTVAISHARRGDLQIELISPNKIVSVLASRRPNDYSNYGFRYWTFMSVKHWGEPMVGPWTLRVLDMNIPGRNGQFYHWQLHLWGESIDPKLAVPVPYSDTKTYTSTHVFPSGSKGEYTVTMIPPSVSTPEVTTTTTSVEPIPMPTTSISTTSTPTTSISTTSTPTTSISTTTTKPPKPTSTTSPTSSVEDVTESSYLDLLQKYLGLLIALIVILFIFIPGLIFFCIRRNRRRKTLRNKEEFQKLNITRDTNDLSSEMGNSPIERNTTLYTTFDSRDSHEYLINQK